jgi:hypothetical protein
MTEIPAAPTVSRFDNKQLKTVWYVPSGFFKYDSN